MLLHVSRRINVDELRPLDRHLRGEFHGRDVHDRFEPLPEQVYKALKGWRERNGKDATFECLMGVLSKIERKDLTGM